VVVLEEQERADPYDQQCSRDRQTTEDGRRNAARRAARVPRRKLIAKKLDALVLADLLKPKMSEPFLQEMQRRLFQPVEKARGRQEQHSGALLTVIWRIPEYLRDLPVRELVRIGKYEHWLGWFRGLRRCNWLAARR
jgi:hypothetical protein